MSRAMKTRTVVLSALLALSLPCLGASGDSEAGRKKSAPCAVCHGQNGISPSPAFPNLAGQYPDYIQTALTHYQNGKRKNPIMQAQVANLSQKDILDLAAYFSAQKGLQAQH
jgi:cytochrome c553